MDYHLRRLSSHGSLSYHLALHIIRSPLGIDPIDLEKDRQAVRHICCLLNYRIHFPFPQLLIATLVRVIVTDKITRNCSLIHYPGEADRGILAHSERIRQQL